MSYNLQDLEKWLLGELKFPLPNQIENLIKKEIFDNNKSVDDLGKKIASKEYDLETLIKISAYVVYINSSQPWLPQTHVLEKFDISNKILIDINNRIKKSHTFQTAIIKLGKAKKYWETIIPFVGKLDNVYNHKFSFPLRLAFYPGVSCMFYCGFCGRNQSAKYPLNQVQTGYEIYKSIIDVFPKESAVSISGGLEPLTNPMLGNIISYAKEKNIRVPLITNGYSLTKNYLIKNPGLWNLDSLRLSLYGVDHETYYYITRLKNSFKLVYRNTIDFLKERNKINPNLKFGFNFIVVDENVDQLERVIDLIEEINKKVDNGPGINFLTLRDDFESVTGKNYDHGRIYKLKGGLSDQRKKLIDTLFNIEKKKLIQCPDLHIDYGYALYPYSKGFSGDQLFKVNDEEMRKGAYPQLSLAVDLNGDIFLYREAGFLNRKGNEKFIIGRIDSNNSFVNLVEKFIQSKKEIITQEGDTRFMDAFDHLLTMILNKFENDNEKGFSLNSHPVLEISRKNKIELGNNWYAEAN